MYKYLSYPLSSETPLYGGASDIKIDQIRQIERGDTSNNSFLSFPNHAGTHIDFPNHFIQNGKNSSDYPAEFWLFHYVYTIFKECKSNELIDFMDSELNTIPENIEFLIINTGFGKYRNEKVYWYNNPGLHPNLASKLKGRFKSLRIIGLDIISITSFQNRELGRLAHKEFLSEPSILLIEDMNLSELKKNPNQLICLPLHVETLDGAPITIIADL